MNLTVACARLGISAWLAWGTPAFAAANAGVGAAGYCARIKDLRVMPFKGEPVKDDVYNGLKAAGPAALPCLIDRVTDTHAMRDPRRSITVDSVAVGDVAVFLVWELGQIAPGEEVPAAVRPAFKEEGVYAYFKYVRKPANRKAMQKYLRDWYQNKYPSPGKGD
jgi:hypothetical protein